MRHVLHIRILLAALLVLFTASSGASSPASGKLSPSLKLAVSKPPETIDVVVFLQDQGSVSLSKSAVSYESPRRAEAHNYLVEQLLQRSPAEDRFRESIEDLKARGVVKQSRHYWITAASALTITSSALNELASIPEVYYVVEDADLELVTPVGSSPSLSGMAGSSNSIDLSGVRQLWEMGYTGHGRIVCGFDTGVEYDHPALTNNWRGADGSPVSQSWFDPYGAELPQDPSGHGTHTMGIMAGRDGADTIGVAFNARWMAASVIDRGQTLSGTISDILAAFEWAADPDGNSATVDDLPDVVCNSWGIPRGLLPTCDDTFWGAIDNLEALGVVVIFACGNEGPDPGTIRNPADRASSPANAFSVGAVDQNLADLPVASFSSRGPSSCGINAVKPEIVAPGVDVRSSYAGGGYRVMSGTSMAAPFIAGCVALLREYNPDATVEQIKSALLQSANDLGPDGEDNDYGWGFIDVVEALDYLPQPQKPRLTKESVMLDNDIETILQSGSTHDLTLSVLNNNIPVEDLYGVLRSNSGNTYVMRDTGYFGSLAAGNSTDNNLSPFIIKLDPFGEPGTPLSFTVDFYADRFGYLNSIDFQLTLGQTVLAESGVLGTERLNVEISNFGRSLRHIDTALNSDLLSNLNLAVASSNQVVYDAFPGSLDWYASDGLQSSGWNSISEMDGSFRSFDGRFRVNQSSMVADNGAEANFLLLDFTISDEFSVEEHVTVGLAADFDLLGGEEVVVEGSDILLHSADYSQFVGVRPLFESAVINVVDGGAYKSGGINESEKYGLLQDSSNRVSTYPGDLALVLSTGAVMFDAAGTRRAGFVIASGATLDEVLSGLDNGADLFLQPTDAGDDNNTTLPRSFDLAQNYPNPFNATTQISFELAQAGEYELSIYNSLGQLVRSYRDVAFTPGRYQVSWNSRNQSGSDVASGVYFYRLTFQGAQQTRKMVLLK